MALAATTAAALVLAGCSAPSPTPPSDEGSDDGPLAALIAAAQAEGQLTLYGSPGQDALQATTDLFTEKYGITVNMTRIVGGQIAARYPTEKAAGAPTADVLVLNIAPFFPQAIEEGIVTPLAELDIPGFPWDLPEEFLRPDYGTAVIGLQVRGITYNTDFIKEGEITDWDDILNPKYKGHLGVPDPGSAPVYVGHWYTVGEHFGGAEQFLSAVGEQLASNGVFASGAPSTAAVGAGEVWAVPMNISGLTKEVADQGGPIKIVIPPGTTADEQAILVNSDPQSPNAAKLFVHFMMSEEGSMELATVGNETSPFDTSKLPETLWTWPLELAAQQKSNVVQWLTGK